MKTKEADVEAQKKRYRVQSVKEAVENNQMSVDRGNEILFGYIKQENKRALAKWIKVKTGYDVPVDAMYDI